MWFPLITSKIQKLNIQTPKFTQEKEKFQILIKNTSCLITKNEKRLEKMTEFNLDVVELTGFEISNGNGD